jgi:pyruvate-formate lyase-activating enzyme
MKAPPERYQEITRAKSDPWPRVQQSISMLLDSDVAFWPRTTYAGGLMTATDIDMILQILSDFGYNGEYIVQNYVESIGVRTEESKLLRKPNREEIDELQKNTPPGISLRLEWR